MDGLIGDKTRQAIRQEQIRFRFKSDGTSWTTNFKNLSSGKCQVDDALTLTAKIAEIDKNVGYSPDWLF